MGSVITELQGTKCELFTTFSAFLHCWLCDRKPVWTFACWWWWPDWSFAHLKSSIVTITTFVVSCSRNIQDGLTFWYQLTQVVLETGQ